MELHAADLLDPERREAASAELADFLRRGLARSFAAQLSDADLDDLSQRSLEKALHALDRFEGRSKLSTWAMSIATREALQVLRGRRHQHVSLEDAVQAGALAMEAPSPVERQQLHDLLHEGIRAALSEGQREALYAELGGLPLAEIARHQGRSRGALYKSLHDARKKLKSWLIERGVEGPWM